MKRTTSVAVGLSLLVLAVAAQAQPAAPKPGPEHKKLEAWVGDWTTEGVGKDDSASPEHKILWTSQARGYWVASLSNSTTSGRAMGRKPAALRSRGTISTRRPTPHTSSAATAPRRPPT